MSLVSAKPFLLLYASALLLAGCQRDTAAGASGAPQDASLSARPAAAPPLAERNARILTLHNQARARVGAAALVWDDQLAAGAGRWAAQLGDSGMLEHSGAEDEGENLWMGTADYYTIDAMVGAWTDEQRDFRPGRFPDVSRSGNWSAVGHYTQMIWPDTRSVGCGLFHGRQWDVLVCRYAPAGNVMGERVP